MPFILAAIALLQALTLFTVLWTYRRHRHCVSTNDYVELADAYLDSLIEVVKSNVRRTSCGEIPLS
jgi:hypothetical protein